MPLPELTYGYQLEVPLPFEDAVAATRDALAGKGFGVLTEIDVRKTFTEKLNVNFRNYRILGSCNPPFAYKALLAEDKIGLMLPCNVIVQETADGRIEVAAIDPAASMQAVQNPALEPIGQEIRAELQKVIDSL